jgi:hypothetical protein
VNHKSVCVIARGASSPFCTRDFIEYQIAVMGADISKGRMGRQATVLPKKGQFEEVFFAVTDVNLSCHQKSTVDDSQRRYDRNGQINSYNPAYGTAHHYCEYREQRVNLELMAHDARRNEIIH